MDRVLVGVDGSGASLAALGWAADVASRARADLIVARVLTRSEGGSETGETDPHHQQELDEWCASLPAAAPRTALLQGDPAGALLDAARTENADLVVIGGRGEGGFIHSRLGGVAHHLAHHAVVPLAIVPGAAAVEHVVVGVDGSPDSLAAVELVADLASRLGVAVTAVFAFEPFVQRLPDNDPRGWRRQAEDDLRGWAAPIEKAGCELTVDVDRDVHPVAALLRAVEGRSGSLVVLGTRGRGGFAGLRLGRVPFQLLHHSDAAVLLVPGQRDD
jgi:nucleotide-binding universal stress UspA family protein